MAVGSRLLPDARRGWNSERLSRYLRKLEPYNQRLNTAFYDRASCEPLSFSVTGAVMSMNALDLSRLLQSERPSLLRMLSRVLDRSLVEDAFQTLWLRVQKVEDDPPINDKRSYLFALAANVAWDQGRELARRRRIQAEANAILWGAERSPSAETMVIAQDELKRVLEAADALSEPTRTIFWLNRIEGIPQRDIAKRLGVSRTTVEKHVRRALAILGDARNGTERER